MQVEAKYPALLFKQQLDAFVQKIFPMLRDNVKKEITPQLAACIHAPRTATTRSRRTMNPGPASDAQGTLGGAGCCCPPAPAAGSDLPAADRCQQHCCQRGPCLVLLLTMAF